MFSRGDYARHVALTQNPACIAAYQSEPVYQPNQPTTAPNAPSDVHMEEASDDATAPDANQLDDNHPQPIHDFFGTDYTREELGWEEDGDTDRPKSPITSDDEEFSDDELSPDEDEDLGWEAPVISVGDEGADMSEDEIEVEIAGGESGDEGSSPDGPAVDNARMRVERALRQQVYTANFPSETAGQPINEPNTATAGFNDYLDQVPHVGGPDNIFSPFESELDWKIARWAKLRGPGSTAVSELLEIPGVQERLDLSYKNSRELNKIVDSLPAMRPKFQREELVCAGEAFDVYMRDIVECLKALYGDAEFARYLVFLPERHYADPDHTLRLYHDMHTGKWWWAVQTAYPVYLTIGNLPKDIRGRPSQRGQILVAYLPTTKLEHITNKAARRRTLSNLFHACMKRILAPLEELGLTGLPMTSGDGVTRRVHPIFAAYIGDYPEQLLVTGVKTGLCPICSVPHDELGDLGACYTRRNIHEINKVLGTADGPGPPTDYANACRAAGIKPIYHPFWEHLPYTNIFLSITPDILHQILQGFVKHVITWIKSAYDTAEIDARCRRFPPNHNVRLFLKGITPLSRLTGREHADICRILLGIIIDMRLQNNTPSAPLIRAVRGLLDFVYLAQYPIHSDESLRSLDDAIRRFHENKHIFIDLGIRADFNIPKLHFCTKHYRSQIEFFGTADNFNTEYTERLHIDFAKEAYRATNKKNEYPQMTLWLERKEKILRHERYVKWVQDGRPPLSVINPLHHHHSSHIKMTRNPSATATFERLGTRYGATQFRECLARFVAQRNNPDARPTELNYLTAVQPILFNKVPVYHKARFWESDFPLYRHASDNYDVIHVRPAREDKEGQIVSAGRFDTALVNDGTGGAVGVKAVRHGTPGDPILLKGYLRKLLHKNQTVTRTTSFSTKRGQPVGRVVTIGTDCITLRKGRCEVIGEILRAFD
ncbi:hypothetical protein EIP86_007856 [Pleurotus ostreatoroseus]|nr:hypothetical protein EIP86_007856 [Pleurotus ostreatoroseus]